jgi:AraC family transcriptional regulator of adaptative response/methylated-DNA-[protein]-cysteine methyltransferase
MVNARDVTPTVDLTHKEMLRATLTRNQDFDGVFYVGVLTTKIFCLPSCKAKKPLPNNIIFFSNRENAIHEGFRGCKRCRAEFFPDTSPKWFNSTFMYLSKEVERKLTEKDLIKIAGVDISTIRRYFKKRFNLSPLAYHRKLRLRYARKLIEDGYNYLIVGTKCGFKSSSGFRNAFIKEFGFPPGELHANDDQY